MTRRGPIGRIARVAAGSAVVLSAAAVASSALAALPLSGAAGARGAPAVTTGTPGTGRGGGTPHVMTIIMENTDYSQFAGSPAMPYLNELAHQYADFTDAYGWHYPSLPNYIALLSGSDQGITTDCDITQTGCRDLTAPTLVTQLEQHHLTWNAYYQGDPTGCYQGDGSGNYPYWHNAFRYFSNFHTQFSHLANFDELIPNLNAPGAADFQWVVPDLVNSGGDNGTMSSGDSWLAGEMPQIMASRWYQEGGQIVILFDTGYEDSGGIGGSSGGQIPLVVVSAHDRDMGPVATPIDTVGVLRSIEQAYHLSYLATAATPSNGNLGGAMVSGRPSGEAAPQLAQGAVFETGASSTTVHPVGRGAFALNGVAMVPGSSWSGATPTGQTIEVGEDSSGTGVVVTPRGQVVPVGGTSNLESVSCASATQCYAVGLAPSDDDEAALVSIVDGWPGSVTPLPALIGLYGIACPTETTCYAVGYDDSTDADAVVTVTDGHASAPQQIDTSVEWLNAISCPTATQCYATGLVDYTPSVVPITAGAFGSAVKIPAAWYASGIDCPSVGHCTVVGENSTEQGTVSTYVNGTVTTQVVPGTEYLYGAGCDTSDTCILAGAGTPPASGYSTGVVVRDVDGSLGPAQTLANTNGIGQVLCDATGPSCLAVGTSWTAGWPGWPW